MKVLFVSLLILVSTNALGCGLAGGSAQYEKNVEGNIAMQEQQLKKYKNLGFADDSEQVKSAKKQYTDALESQPISKNVDTDKYDKTYRACVAKLNMQNNTNEDVPAPCSNQYTDKSCMHEAFEGSKK